MPAKNQWHPLFVELLRPLVESHYHVETNVSVGDVPREADIVLLRRASSEPLPFQGLWRNLTTWNILEFKGPTVAPRLEAIDLLVELGLGIQRRFNERRRRERQRGLPPEEVSFWLLTNRIGKRFLRDCQARLGALDALSPGLWRAHVLGRSVFLVSAAHLPIEQDSLALHVIGNEPLDMELQVAEFIAQRPHLVEPYGRCLLSLHPELKREIETMARAARGKIKVHFQPLLEVFGKEMMIEEVGWKYLVEGISAKSLKDLADSLSADKRKILRNLLDKREEAQD